MKYIISYVTHPIDPPHTSSQLDLSLTYLFSGNWPSFVCAFVCVVRACDHCLMDCTVRLALKDSRRRRGPGPGLSHDARGFVAAEGEEMLDDMNMPPSQALFYIAHNNEYNNSMGTVSAHHDDKAMCVYVNCALLVLGNDPSMAIAQGGGSIMITLSMAMSLALCKVGCLLRQSKLTQLLTHRSRTLCKQRIHFPIYRILTTHPFDFLPTPSFDVLLGLLVG